MATAAASLQRRRAEPPPLGNSRDGGANLRRLLLEGTLPGSCSSTGSPGIDELVAAGELAAVALAAWLGPPLARLLPDLEGGEGRAPGDLPTPPPPPVLPPALALEPLALALEPTLAGDELHDDPPARLR
eukprot:CAMPEP_0174739108 /NCGR_PEP_ID=MMETSP1094-20130205/71056_1 /TAXON_ID=156173 /ORGANISM="Chrysochromulina brevifilum, Strain UTEX LB 985" /LENGTH=129 /DNA_ID=CAMNT_0015942625 /DNA_START=284 /DNA_END=671 /DNA_ORIENTATION=-